MNHISHCQIDFLRDGQEKIIATGEMDIFFVKNDVARLVKNGKEIFLYGNPLDAFEEILLEYRKYGDAEKNHSPLAIGFISYDAKSLIYSDINFKNKIGDFPQMWFALPKENNFKKKEPIFNKKGWISSAQKESIEKYRHNFKLIQCHIYEGNLYQINITFPIKYKFEGDPYSFYKKIFSDVKPEMGAYFDIYDQQILSFSPERFFKIQNGVISANPIKGTASRSRNKTIDNKRRQGLMESLKDKAEHIMIVDLLRNDIGKISETDSVTVNNLFSIKSHETVHHIESEIEGKLNTNSISDIFRAMFPGGSITGAPKKRVVEIIDEIEDYSRGIYTGAIGWIDFKGNMDFSVAIRTMIINDNKATYPVGGGIVADSTLRGEYDEAILKAKIITRELDVLGVSKR